MLHNTQLHAGWQVALLQRTAPAALALRSRPEPASSSARSAQGEEKCSFRGARSGSWCQAVLAAWLVQMATFGSVLVLLAQPAVLPSSTDSASNRCRHACACLEPVSVTQTHQCRSKEQDTGQEQSHPHCALCCVQANILFKLPACAAPTAVLTCPGAC